MATNEVHQGDIGTIFRLTIKDGATAIDVSSAATAGTKQIVFTKPDGTVVTQDAVFTNTGTDGQIQYVTLSGDLDQAGLWQNQARVNLTSGDWKSDTATFRVHANL